VLGVLITVAMVYAPLKNQARWQATGVAILVVAMLVALGVQSAGTPRIDCGVRGQDYYCSAS
jgi:hypothetical protein